MQGVTREGIVIEDDCWLGHGVTVLDGVTIGKGSVTLAGSVVTKDIPPFFSIYCLKDPLCQISFKNGNYKIPIFNIPLIQNNYDF